MATLDSPALTELASFQHGVLTRGQVLAAGLTSRQVEWRVTSGRWECVHPGVYVTQPGRHDRASTHSSAVLACGPGAVLSRQSAAAELGPVRRPPALVQVSVPWSRRVVAPDGVQVHRAVELVRGTEDWQWPPRTSVEVTVMDVAADGTAADAVAIAALACQRGLTWYEALLVELGRRKRHPFRAVLLDALADIGEGSQSTLEVRFLRDVVRPHGLPRRRLQRLTEAGAHDLGVDAEKVLVELDGLSFHGRRPRPNGGHAPGLPRRLPGMADTAGGLGRCRPARVRPRCRRGCGAQRPGLVGAVAPLSTARVRCALESVTISREDRPHPGVVHLPRSTVRRPQPPVARVTKSARSALCCRRDGSWTYIMWPAS